MRYTLVGVLALAIISVISWKVPMVRQFAIEHGAKDWADVWFERGYWASQITLAIVASVAAAIALGQVRLMRKNSADQNFIAILARTAEHNWEIFGDDQCKRAIEIFQELSVPADDEGRKLYWAARIVHLSHVLLIQQVWVLAGKPHNLTGTYENWQRFAQEVARDIREAAASNKPEPYKLACADYWEKLQDLEETDRDFVEWLKRISERSPSA